VKSKIGSAFPFLNGKCPRQLNSTKVQLNFRLKAGDTRRNCAVNPTFCCQIFITDILLHQAWVLFYRRVVRIFKDRCKRGQMKRPRVWPCMQINMPIPFESTHIGFGLILSVFLSICMQGKLFRSERIYDTSCCQLRSKARLLPVGSDFSGFPLES